MAFVIAIIIRERAHARPHHLGGGLFVVGRCRPVGQSLWLLELSVRQPDNCPSVPSHGPLPPLPSGEEPRAHRVMQAEGRRSRGGRSVASDSGGRRDCRAASERLRQGAGRESPKTSAPRPLRAGRARRALKAPRRPLRKGRPRRGSRRAVVEAAGSVPSDEAGAREPRGRHRPADPKDPFSASPPRLFSRPGSASGVRPGCDSARASFAEVSVRER